MTIRYCDFCGEVIPEGQGDPITLADVESMPEAAKDACEDCTAILWAFTKHKNLKAASLKASSDKPPLTSRADSEIPERGKWRVGSKVPLNVYDGDRPVCQCHGFMDALEIVNAMNTIRHVERLSGGFRFVPTSRGLRVHDLSGTWDTCRIEKEISETGLYQDFAYFPNREDAAAVFALLTQPAGGPPTSDPAASPNSTP